MLTALAVALASIGSLSLPVPYLPQTDALCGGAAAAMVFRYWGDVHADIDQFAPLVDKRAGGIASDALVRAIEQRGWIATTVHGSIDQIREEIEHGHPVVILVAGRGAAYHYLVVTGVEPDAVIVHDPTWGPSRRITVSDLTRMWEPAHFWSLVVQPAANRASAAGAEPPPVEDTGPLGELAGVRFAERRWREAAELAQRAVVLNPSDRYAWEVLAASRFIQDDPVGALRAWNQIGKPRVNLVVVEGLTRARFQTIAAAIGLRPNMLLTERAFRLAERRLQDLPDRSIARLTLRPEPDGFVTVKAVLVERPGSPQGAVGWTAAALQAGIDREARVALPGSTGQGEVWSAGWRWWSGRPRVAVGFAAPHVGSLPGVWRVDASWDSQSYSALDGELGATTGANLRESRTHGALTISQWLGPNIRYSVAGGIDSWSSGVDRRRTILTSGLLERRWRDDRWTIAASATRWTPFGAGNAAPAFYVAGLRTAFRSSQATETWTLLAGAGIERSSDAAPLGVWPGAGEGRVRDALLRAHPLLNDGVVELNPQSMLGRSLMDAHGEVQHWMRTASPVRVGVAGFADAARVSRRWAPAPLAQVDVGGGLRLRIPGAAGTLRVDLGHGLRDHADALTVGWQH